MAQTLHSGTETTGGEKYSSSLPGVIGLDIGTSQCCAAIWKGSHLHILNTIGHKYLRYAYLSYQRDISGEDIAGSTIFNMKRLIGRMDIDQVLQMSKTLPFDLQILYSGALPSTGVLVENLWKPISPIDALGQLLVQLKEFAKTCFEQAIEKVVLCVPVSFNRFRKIQMEEACNKAGFSIVSMIYEPAAAALFYAQHRQIYKRRSFAREKTYLVFNMGGGYCNIAVTSLVSGRLEVRALAGNATGGQDLIQNMMYYLFPEYIQLYSSRGINEIKSIALLRTETEDVIHRLSDTSRVEIEVNLPNGVNIHKAVTREEFEQVNKQIFDNCEIMVKQCLLEATVEPAALNRLIVVGGCSYIPKIRNILMDICKKNIAPDVAPISPVVCGAALEGALASGITDPFGSSMFQTIHVTPLGIGNGAEGNTFIPIIPKNSTIPVRKHLVFTTVHDNQTEVLLLFYEGESNDADLNQLIGFIKIPALPLEHKGVLKINVFLDTNASGKLRAMAEVINYSSQHTGVLRREASLPNVDETHKMRSEELGPGDVKCDVIEI